MINPISAFFTFPSDEPLQQLKRDTTRHRNEISAMAKIQHALVATKKKAENLEALVRAVVNATPDLLWAKDLGPKEDGVDGRFTFTNKAKRKFLGVNSLHDSLGKCSSYFADLAAQNGAGMSYLSNDSDTNTDLAMYEANKDASEDKCIPCNFLETGTMNGELIQLMVIKMPLFRNGVIIGMVGSARDVTEEYGAPRQISDELGSGIMTGGCTGSDYCKTARSLLQDHMTQYEFVKKKGS